MNNDTTQLLCIPVSSSSKPRKNATPRAPKSRDSASTIAAKVTSYLTYHYKPHRRSNKSLSPDSSQSSQKSSDKKRCNCLDKYLDESKGIEAVPEAVKILAPVFLECRSRMASLNPKGPVNSRRDFLKQILERDYNPTNREIHLESMDKQDLYNEYRSEVESYIQGEEPVSLKMFLYIWNLCFSHVKIRKFKAVTGKCLTCALLTNLRAKPKNREQLEKITILHALHKYTYMKCRKIYYLNSSRAVEMPHRYMSIIMDGMAQAHTELPFLANQNRFTYQLPQHLLGIKEHGQKFVIYRSYANIVNNRDLAIYCLLSQIENRLQRCGVLPPILYIQIDGGSENANETLLAVCEYLVFMGIFQNVFLTRLPVGHTHEDIDAQFGKIWTYIRRRPITSPQEYAQVLYELFGKNSFELVDVKVVPSYERLFEKCIDKPKRWTKEELTQLAWKFEKTGRNSVRTMYKKYPCNEVFELIEDQSDPDVPYQAVKSICRDWQPTASPQYGIKKTGMRILRSYPFGHVFPADFVQSHRDTFNQCFEAIKAKLPKNVVDDWKAFEHSYPKTANAMDYLKNENGVFHFPLAEKLFPQVQPHPDIANVQRLEVTQSSVSTRAPPTRKVAANIVQYATPSVLNSTYKGIRSRLDPKLVFPLPPYISVSVGEEEEKMKRGQLDIEQKLREIHSIPLRKEEAYNKCTVAELHMKIIFRHLEGDAKNEIGGLSNARKPQLVSFLLKADQSISDPTAMEI